MTSRKDLLLESEKSVLNTDQIQSLRATVGESGIFIEMMSTPGWKQLMREFIEPRTSNGRYLGASREDLADVRAAQRELNELLSYITSRVSEGNKAIERLKNNK